MNDNLNGEDRDATQPSDGALAVVRVFADRSHAEDHGLAVLAMGLPYWLFVDEHGFSLWVERAHAGAVEEELSRYEREANRPAPAIHPVEAGSADAAIGVLCFWITISMFGWADVRSAGALSMAGRLDANAIFGSAESWRVITSLTLHANIGHLLGNAAGGAFFGYLASRQLGAGPAWLLTLLCGALGNLLTAWIYRATGHLAVGASTAVFAALGLLAGRTILPDTSANHASGRRRRLLPLAAALVLLALLGAGGHRADVVAHACGFVAGCVCGWSIALAGIEARLRRAGWCGIAAATLLAICWYLALAWLRRVPGTN